MIKTPFTIIPWQHDFLQTLLAIALRNGNLADAVFIFPHQRPEQYITHHLQHHPHVQRPLILPKCYTISTLFSHLRQALVAKTAWDIGLLDKVGLLLECVREDAATLQENETNHFLQNAELFFPWGVRLAALFEECFTHKSYPDDFLYIESEVSPFAAKLLGRLAALFNLYTTGLNEHNWTTQGYDALQVAEQLEAGEEIPQRFFANKQIYIAGFHALTTTENILFHHLWRNHNAHVIVHADQNLATNKASHWSCAPIVQWAKEWHTQCDLCQQDLLCMHDSAQTVSDEYSTILPHKIQYYQGFDLHSQLEVIQQLLTPKNATATNESPTNECNQSCYSASTAIVLPDSGLLMPVLHHLPQVDTNVSMGYPLSRSPLFLLLETIFSLQERKKGDGYYWQDLITLVRHPYIKMLEPAQQEIKETANNVTFPAPENNSLRRELQRFEHVVRNADKKFPVPLHVWEQVFGLLHQEEMPAQNVLLLIDAIMNSTLKAFETPRTPKQLAQALEALCSMLLMHGSHLWERFPIDAECLHRLMQSTIPELMHSSLSHEVFPIEALISMARQLLQAERVPFEANPLVGLQVMGMLETRLLTVETLIIADTTEDYLPGTTLGNPLLPDPLRPLLGLPSLHTREQVSASHFFRMIHGAKNVHLLWQEGMDTGTADQKKQKSRFVEELIWQQEKQQQRLMDYKGKEENFTPLQAALSPTATKRLQVDITPATAAFIQQQVCRHVSPTLLDAYLQCPVRFYYERILNFSPTETVTEGDDPKSIGNVLHKALEKFYEPRLNQLFFVTPENHPALLAELLDCVISVPAYQELANSLPADALSMFKQAATIRLNDYLANQQPTMVIGLETKLTHSLDISGTNYLLVGNIDRIDLRDNSVVILDYKTGNQKNTAVDFWHDISLWTRIVEWQPTVPAQENVLLLENIRKNIGSIQLPFYLALFHNTKQQYLQTMQQAADYTLDAGFISLSDKGQEHLLFKQDITAEKRNQCIADQTPLLLQFLLRNITQSPCYLPLPGNACDYCAVQSMCLQQHN